MKEHLTPQAIRSKEKKQHIFETAMEMFSEYGYEQTTVRDICHNANVTTSTFYHFFKDKRGILLAFYYQILEKGIHYLDPTPEHMQHPFQAICDFFVATSIYIDQYEKDVAMALFQNTADLINGRYPALSRMDVIFSIERLLSKSKEAGNVSAQADCHKIAQYLLISSYGIAAFNLTLAAEKKYMEIACEQFPLAFKAVTDQKIAVRIPEELCGQQTRAD